MLIRLLGLLALSSLCLSSPLGESEKERFDVDKIHTVLKRETGCAELEDITVRYFYGREAAEIAELERPTFTNDGRTKCSKEFPDFFYQNMYTDLVPASGLRCTGGKWYVEGSNDKASYDRTRVACAKAIKEAEEGTECNKLGDISLAALHKAFPGVAYHTTARPTVSDGRASCSDADTPMFAHTNENGEILFGDGIRCDRRLWWYAINDEDNIPYTTTNVVCANGIDDEGPRKGTEDCDNLGKIVMDDFNWGGGIARNGGRGVNVYRYQHPESISPPTVTAGYATCHDPNTNFYFLDKDNYVRSTLGMTCIGGKWYSENGDKIPYATTRVACGHY